MPQLRGKRAYKRKPRASGLSGIRGSEPSCVTRLVSEHDQAESKCWPRYDVSLSRYWSIHAGVTRATPSDQSSLAPTLHSSDASLLSWKDRESGSLRLVRQIQADFKLSAEDFPLRLSATTSIGDLLPFIQVTHASPFDRADMDEHRGRRRRAE